LAPGTLRAPKAFPKAFGQENSNFLGTARNLRFAERPG
jgi:hypothetical protein